MADEIDISEVVGPYAWGIIHHAAESFPCPPCAAEGASLMRFAHDLINHKLGKDLVAPDDLRAWAPVVREAEASLVGLSPDLAAQITAAMGPMADQLEHAQERDCRGETTCDPAPVHACRNS